MTARRGNFSPINDPEIAKAVAEAYVAGASTQEIADQFEVAQRTIRTWIKDPRVAAHSRTIAVERMQRITRKIDSQIEARLAHPGDLETELLLKIRKEYLERGVRALTGEEKEAGDATNELAEAMDQNPDFAAELRKLMNAPTSGE